MIWRELSENEKMEKIKIIKLIVILLGFLVFNSCSNNEIFTAEMKFAEDKWIYSEPFKGSFEIKDTAQTYDIMLNISHKDNYSFQNIYLRITDDFTGVTKTDTVNINLADEYGVWKGKGISDNRSLDTTLRKKFRFKEKRNYSFNIEQFSRQDSLPGILNIEFLIQGSEK